MHERRRKERNQMPNQQSLEIHMENMDYALSVSSLDLITCLASLRCRLTHL